MAMENVAIVLFHTYEQAEEAIKKHKKLGFIIWGTG
jgi:hypothetical protein